MRRKPRPGGGKQVEVTIESLGGRGDGIAQLGADLGTRPVFVPGTVPGDRVRLRLTGERGGAYRGAVIELLEAGPGRVEPPCPYFGPCGGCALQHWEAARYADWKAGLLGQALARRGLSDVTIRPLVQIPPGTRRRAVLAARCGPGNRIVLGFHERAGHDVVDIESCLLLTPALLALLPALRALLGSLLPAGARAQATLIESEMGIDLLLQLPALPDLQAREALAAFAEQEDLARLSCCDAEGTTEPIAMRRPPQVTFGGVAVVPPPGGFLQPSAAGEAALTEALLAYLPEEASPVADLYAGCGTFSFAIAAQGAPQGQRKVHAVEADAASLSALCQAARVGDLASRVSGEERDLERRPLAPEELKDYAAVIFDPPRAGAKAQAEAIARSSVPLAVAISCNPNSFARDARTLVDGGFTLVEATPIDQFPWSGHLELVALFRR